MVWKKEMLQTHFFQTLLWKLLLGRSRKTRRNCNQMGYISRWSVLKMYTLNNSTGTVIHASTEVGLEVWAEELHVCCYVAVSSQESTAESWYEDSKQVVWKCAMLRYLQTTVTNQNLIQEKIKGTLNFIKAFYHSVLNLLSFRLLSKNIAIRTYKTIILRALCVGVKLDLWR
jgi:hypothetical protein